MELRQIEISKLNPAAYNPRKILTPDEPEYAKLERSILTFGEVEPIVWNERTGNVVGGHQRLTVLKRLGRTETLVSVVDLDIDSEKLLNVALNKIKGAWDRAKLEELLADFTPEDAALTGFNPAELAVMVGSDGDYAGGGDWLDSGSDDSSEWDDEDDDSGGNSSTDGTSFIVTLEFQSNFIAQQWAVENGYPKAIKDGIRTTVIRM